MSGAEILDVSDLPPAILGSAEAPPVPSPSDAAWPHRSFREAVSGFEKQLIEHALARTAGNRAEAARLLGLARPQLYTKMDEYDIKDPGRRPKGS